MAESIYLVGSDDVRSAANTIRSAADTMRSAAGSIDSSLRQHQNFLEDWLSRFTQAMEQQSK